MIVSSIQYISTVEDAKYFDMLCRIWKTIFKPVKTPIYYILGYKIFYTFCLIIVEVDNVRVQDMNTKTLIVVRT